MTMQKQTPMSAADRAVILVQQAINFNKQAAALTQKAMTATQQAHALLASNDVQGQEGAAPVKQGQPQPPKKQKQKTPITKEASARIQSAADRRDKLTSPLSAGYFRPFGSWDDDD